MSLGEFGRRRRRREGEKGEVEDIGMVVACGGCGCGGRAIPYLQDLGCAKLSDVEGKVGGYMVCPHRSQLRYQSCIPCFPALSAKLYGLQNHTRQRLTRSLTPDSPFYLLPAQSNGAFHAQYSFHFRQNLHGLSVLSSKAIISER